MLVSVKERYALRIAAEIAQRSKDKPISLRVIANDCGVSLKYLEQIVMPLRRAKVLDSTRGATGGYKLARSASKITAGDVLRATEVAFAELKEEESEFWKGYGKALNTYLDSVTLADLLKERNNL